MNIVQTVTGLAQTQEIHSVWPSHPFAMAKKQAKVPQGWQKYVNEAVDIATTYGKVRAVVGRLGIKLWRPYICFNTT